MRRSNSVGWRRAGHELARLVVVATAAGFALGMAQRPPQAPLTPESVTPFIQTELAKPNGVRDDVRRFYALHAFAPAWMGSAEADAQRAEALDALRGADADGLRTRDYLPDPSLYAHPPGTEQKAAETDLVLTAGLLAYAHDMRLGRVAPNAVYSDIDLPAGAFDASGGLATALHDNLLPSFLAGLAPPHPEYARLKLGLAHYRALAAAGGWPAVPGGPVIEPDETGPRVEALRARLIAEFPALKDQADFRLDVALRDYQARSGLEANGRAGAKTLAMLAIPAAMRVEQIEANMERWRWLPNAFEASHLVVNVPDASLTLVEAGKPVLTSKVIVGTAKNPSPIMRAMVLGVTANPDWDVPASIARKEMLPKLQADRRFLAKQHIVLVNGPPGDPFGENVNWKAISPARFPYALKQLPGEDNALGRVKLELPNVFSTYLHDTPARQLFQKPERYFSHGCIRVEQIMPLAKRIVKDDPATQDTDLDAALTAGKTEEFKLSRPLPVYALYWTALAQEDGEVDFRHDVYSRDAVLVAALSGQRPQSLANSADACGTGRN